MCSVGTLFLIKSTSDSIMSLISCSDKCSSRSKDQPLVILRFLVAPRAQRRQPAVFANQSRNKLFVPHIIIICPLPFPVSKMLTHRLKNNRIKTTTTSFSVTDGRSRWLLLKFTDQNKNQLSECQGKTQRFTPSRRR